MGYQTATNPKTGERVILINDEWKPVEQSATNQQGVKAYKVGGAWLTDETPVPQAPASSEGMPVDRKRPEWSELPGNIVPSLGNIYSAVIHPIDTAKAAISSAAGGAGIPEASQMINKNLPARKLEDFDLKQMAALAQAQRNAGAVGEHFGRYTSIEGIRNAFITDPAGVIADLSMLAGGGAAATSRAGMTGTAATLGKISKYTNPMTPVAPVIAAPIKLGAKGVGYVWNALAPKETALLAASEGQGPQIVNALRNYDEYVAGGMPTAGAAVAGQMTAPRYAALQEQVSGLMPREYMLRQETNKAAREKAIGTIAQDEAAKQAAERARTNVSKPLYEASEQGIADVSGVATTLDDIIAKNPGNRQLVRELKQIRNDLVADTKTGALRTDAKQVSSVIDGIKARLAKEDNKHIQGQLREVREALVDTIPGYRQAQEAFAAASKPINIMQVGQYLEGKLKPALETSTGERAASFAEAVKNAPTTIKRSTGQSRFDKLGDILEPDQVKIVEGIRKDLTREAEFKKQAQAGSKAGEVFPATEAARLPNMMSRITSIANTIMTKLQGKIDQKLAMELATEMLDPKLAAAAMEKALARQAKGERLADPFKRGGAAAYEGLKSPATASVLNALSTTRANQNQLRND